MIRVLLVDDERAFARTARRTLRGAGTMQVKVDDCRTARAALARLRDRRYDAVLVDWVLPDLDGIELCTRIRSLPNRRCALIMVTGRCFSPEDERTALAAGFDDFVRKPFDPETLGLRINAAVRRIQRARDDNAFESSRHGEPGSAAADAALDVLSDEHVALVFSRVTRLTTTEWKLLRVLFLRRGRVVERGTLIHEVWGDSRPSEPHRALDQHMGNMRAKLGGQAGSLVETVRGHGFRLAFWRTATLAPK